MIMDRRRRTEEDENEDDDRDANEEEEDNSNDDDDDDEDEEEDDEEDSGSDDDEEEDNEVPLEESLAFGREKRPTMGKRMSNLVGEELEKDEGFWGDEKWNEDDAESEYSNESDSADEVDTDFDEGDDGDAMDDDEEDEEAEMVAAAKDKKSGKTSKYKEPQRKAARGRPRSVPTNITPEEMERLKEERKEAARQRRQLALLAPVDRAKRASTKQKTEAMQEAQAKRQSQDTSNPPVPKPPRVSQCSFSQKDLLVEACSTEQDNVRWLLSRKRLQNESDNAGGNAPKRQIKLAARFVSRRGCNNVVNFPEVDLMPEILKAIVQDEQGRKRVKRPLCVITGLPAKYLDPLTNEPYANLAAFKTLRADQRFLSKENEQESQDDTEDDSNGEEDEEQSGVGKGGFSRSSSMSFGTS